MLTSTRTGLLSALGTEEVGGQRRIREGQAALKPPHGLRQVCAKEQRRSNSLSPSVSQTPGLWVFEPWGHSWAGDGPGARVGQTLCDYFLSHDR